MHATVCDVGIVVLRETVLFFPLAISFVLTRISPVSLRHTHTTDYPYTQVGQCGNQVGTMYVDRERDYVDMTLTRYCEREGVL